MSLSHGVYETDTPAWPSLNGTLARFQKDEFASGEVANAKSPMPAARASAEIRKKGTAVVTTFIGSTSWDLEAGTIPHKIRSEAVSLIAVGLISKGL